MDKQKLKQDLLITVMCIFLVLLIMLILGCTFLHYKLMTKDITLKKELKSCVIQTHCVETRIVLSPSQAEQLASSRWIPALPPPQPPALSLSQSPSQPPSQPQSSSSVAPAPKSRSALPPKQKKSTLSISHIYGSHSSESIHSNESGRVYSVEEFQRLYGPFRCYSAESLEGKGSQDEEGGGSNDSGSIILCAIHQM